LEAEIPLINKMYLLQKFPGKGGWTYAEIPEVLQDKHAPFGWVQVRGSIDTHELNHYKLMPMGNGKLFLPVKAEIRKKIGKNAGDWVHVVLFADQSPVDIPEELMLCLQDDPTAHETFMGYTAGQQKEFIDWIYGAKTDDTKVARIAETLRKLSRQKKLRDK
jgi:hypothetical protein